MNPDTSGQIPLPGHGGMSEAVARLADNPWARTVTPGSILGLLIWLVVHLQGMQAEINGLLIWQAEHQGEHKAAAEMYKRELDHWKETRAQSYIDHGMKPPPRLQP